MGRSRSGSLSPVLFAEWRNARRGTRGNRGRCTAELCECGPTDERTRRALGRLSSPSPDTSVQLYGTGSQPRTRKLTIMQFEQEEPNASAEPTVRISALSSDLILEIVEHLPCHVALAGLSGTCWALRRVITADVMETKVRALSDMRGWCSSHPDPDYAQVSHLTVAAPTAAGTSPLPMTQPHGWKITRRYGSRLRYASRVNSLPPPHAAWPLGSSGKFLRVGAVAGCRFASIRAAVAAAADGDTLLLSSR